MTSEGTALSALKSSPLTKHDLVLDSLAMLGWQEVCVQVGRFCRTPMGMEAAHGPHGLALGSSREVSERLLRETEQALHLTTP